MRLGIDFDNTIVCYDALFHRVALEGAWIPANLPANKSDVRNHLRQIGREVVWTEMQGRVYGPRLAEASPFPGVLEFFETCRRAGIPVCIISHKTRTPFAGEPHDLHQAALDWLEAQGFFDPARIGLPRSQVFLELTKQAKLQRIGACQCTHFIDDLPEFLAEASFPVDTTRILFDPNRLYGPEVPFQRLHAWSDAAELLPVNHPQPNPPRLAEHLTLPPASGPERTAPDNLADLIHHVRALLPLTQERITLEPLPGGANNQVYRVQAPGGPLVLKRYFQSPDDPRDRFGAEHALYQWAQSQGIRRTAEFVAWNLEQRLAIFRFVEGRKLHPGEPEIGHIDQAVAFVLELNARRDLPEARSIPMASEACFSVADHLDRIAGRVDRLARFQPATPLDQLAADFVSDQLVPRWQAVRASILRHSPTELTTVLTGEDRCISPSDFGFHNALLTPDGTLRFLDFEYAGWDDPAKLVCDFFCQPQIPVADRFRSRAVEALGAGLGWGDALALRAALLLPAYRLKWCCILLNEFLRTGQARRAFASTDLGTEERKASQLAKAQQALHGPPVHAP